MNQDPVGAYKARLREASRENLRARRPRVVAALRNLLAAIDDAEAVDPSEAPPVEHGVIAGGSVGLGAGDVPRRGLTEADLVALFERELREWRDAMAEYRALGRHEEADDLASQIEALETLRPSP